jgi:hypothetical protein
MVPITLKSKTIPSLSEGSVVLFNFHVPGLTPRLQLTEHLPISFDTCGPEMDHSAL